LNIKTEEKNDANMIKFFKISSSYIFYYSTYF